jgi:hypothetical protein
MQAQTRAANGGIKKDCGGMWQGARSARVMEVMKVMKARGRWVLAFITVNVRFAPFAIN